MRSAVLFRTGNSIEWYDCGVLLRDTETLVVLTVLLVVIPYNFKLSAHGMSRDVLTGLCSYFSSFPNLQMFVAAFQGFLAVVSGSQQATCLQLG